MGLDMYAFVTTEVPDSPVDFEVAADTTQRIATWRKHPDLHGWMEELYWQRKGKGLEGGFFGHDFNCVNLALTLEDLDRLEQDVLADRLPHTEGFFFGESMPEDRATTLAFIEKARQEIGQGRCVYYTSWW